MSTVPGVVVMSPQSMVQVQVWVSLVPGSVMVAVMSTGVPWGTGPAGWPVMVTWGSALAAVSSVSAGVVPLLLLSSAVAVRVSVPSSAGDVGGGEVGDHANGACVDVGPGGDVPGDDVAVDVGDGGGDRQSCLRRWRGWRVWWWSVRR